MRNTLFLFKHARKKFKTTYFLLNPCFYRIFKGNRYKRTYNTYQLPISFGTYLSSVQGIKG